MIQQTSHSNLLPPINLLVLFTWDVSLKIWEEKGLLQREVLYYTRLAEQGIKISFLTWGDKEDFEIGKILHPNINVLPIYTQIPCPKTKFLRAVASLLSLWAARSIFQTANIIKTNQMWGGWIAILAKFIFRKPLLVRTGFELYRFTCLQGKGFLRKSFTWIISYVTYKSADLIYLATNDDKNFVVETFNIPSKNISIRPNWIDTEKFSPQQQPASSSYNSNRILFVGRLNEQKNIPLLIEAIAGTEWGLDIYGTGELLETLQKLAMHKRAGVRFMGSVANDKLPNIYNSYPVFALLSHYEGNPKSLLEAMSCGCAVLGTNVEGINSVIMSGTNGFLCEKTVDSVRNFLNKLMTDLPLRKEMGLVARQQIVETQSINSLILQEINNYMFLIENK